MKTQIKCYEQYPLWIVFLSNLVSIAIYLSGAYIIYQVGAIWLAAYLLYILFLEFRLMRNGCTKCYYYGKFCAFGRGRLSAVFFRRGNARGFSQRKMTWKDIIPDFLVSIVAFLAGIALLVIKFNFFILLLVILLLILTSAGNGFVRGTLACRYCRQREMGCPAEKIFKKANKNRAKTI